MGVQMTGFSVFLWGIVFSAAWIAYVAVIANKETAEWQKKKDWEELYASLPYKEAETPEQPEIKAADPDTEEHHVGEILNQMHCEVIKSNAKIFKEVEYPIIDGNLSFVESPEGDIKGKFPVAVCTLKGDLYYKSVSEAVRDGWRYAFSD